MKDWPSINQVAIVGLLTQIEHKPDVRFNWLFQVQVQSSYRKAEVTLLCGVAGDARGRVIQNASVGKDSVLINGKIRNGGFVQVRDLSILGEMKSYPPPIHHVALMGEITSIRSYPETVYVWQFDMNVYREYGGEENDRIEAALTCGLGGGSPYVNALVEAAHPGQWVTVQGKVRDKGFIQVRSFCIFDIAIK